MTASYELFAGDEAIFYIKEKVGVGGAPGEFPTPPQAVLSPPFFAEVVEAGPDMAWVRVRCLRGGVRAPGTTAPGQLVTLTIWADAKDGKGYVPCGQSEEFYACSRPVASTLEIVQGPIFRKEAATPQDHCH